MRRRRTGSSGSVSLLVVIMLPALVVRRRVWCSTADANCRCGARRRPPPAPRRGPPSSSACRRSYGGGLDAALAQERAGAELGGQRRDRSGGRERPDGHRDRHRLRRLLPAPRHGSCRPRRLGASRAGCRPGASNHEAQRRSAARSERCSQRWRLVVGVPSCSCCFVGNPWPGRARIELRDEVGGARRCARRRGVVAVGPLRRCDRRRGSASSWRSYARRASVEPSGRVSRDAHHRQRGRASGCWPSDSSPRR